MRCNNLLKVIIFILFLLVTPLLASAEQWALILDNGQGSGKCTFIEEHDGTTSADGTWNYNDKGTIVYGTYVNASVTIVGTSISIKATGKAISPSSPPGYNTSPYVLTISGKALNGSGDGAFQTIFSNPFWSPNLFSGTWTGTRLSGSGITPEIKAMPWLYLLLKK